MRKKSRPNIPLITAPKKMSMGLERRFYIDYSWWEKSSRSIETYLSTRLGGNIVAIEKESVDLIDPITAEVRQASGFEYAMQHYFNQLPPDYIARASVVDAIFCVLLANGNRPMTIVELAEQINRRQSLISRTLGSGKVYQGIRQYMGD